MTLYYVVGGGLGHLTRARSLLYSLNVQDKVTILTASPFANKYVLFANAKIKLIPRELEGNLSKYKKWLHSTIVQLKVDTIYIDAFPTGIIGEWNDFPFPKDVSLIHVARILNWEKYKTLISGISPCFDLTYIVEPLAKDHEYFLRNQSKSVLFKKLHPPPYSNPDDKLYKTLSEQHKSIWLIIHSGSEEEIKQLIAYSEDMSKIEKAKPLNILITPHNIKSISSKIMQYKAYPVYHLFPLVDRIISACGFNIMNETEIYSKKHYFLPFERRFDDQFLRAEYRKMSMM